ncbi:tRNA-synt-1c domain-containing protein [Mycena sanguinolenta]|uniref:glutamate--tRNA ligase n=1 Tax=Mycena sanguinolenta TaxID=230812 RepID=A0A8H6ZCB0_9AGAR|nr:tRNA-synt-1c domain-containing protein [Mycena sanguinolenta]
MVLLRFAPSPTGALHLGGLRMALYNHLYARKNGGKWVLRIEDTDAQRFVPGATDGILHALEWAGLDYDYGIPSILTIHAKQYDAAQAPEKSERLDLYRSYTTKLLASGHAYRCFCSVDTLLDIRTKFARMGSNQSYDKRCLHLTEEEVARRVRAGESHIVRLNNSALIPRLSTTDLVFGSLKDAHGSVSTDPILVKSDGYPTYHLANVVDDHSMGITHVLRGEEWITSLPLHLDIYSALGLEPPQFAHIPILLNPDGTKMSKRNGDVKVEDYVNRGWERSAILNWLALAGWGTQQEAELSPELAELRSQSASASEEAASMSEKHSSATKAAPESTKVMDMDELISEFEISAITHRSSSLDPGKLAFLNRQHLLRSAGTPTSMADVAARVREWMNETRPLGKISDEYTTPEYIQSVIRVLDSRLINIRDMVSLAPYLFVEPDYTSDEAQRMIRRSTSEERGTFSRVATRSWAVYRSLDQILGCVFEALQNIDPQSWNIPKLHEVLTAVKTQLQTPLFLPLVRYALTAMKDGPPIVDLLVVLGRQRTLNRLRHRVAAE